MMTPLTPGAQAAADAEWVMHDTSPIERIVSVCAELPDGRIFVSTGCDVDTLTITNSTWIYDPYEMTWEQVADCPNVTESSCGVAMPDGSVYMFGGMYGPLLKNALIYNVSADTWGVGPALPTELIIAEAVALDDHRILIAGGLNTSFLNNVTDQCWIFDITDQEFTAAADLPAKRCCGMMAAYGSTVYYFGGTNNTLDNSDDIYAYDIGADAWSTIGHLPGDLLNAAVVAGEYGNIYLIGGRGSFNWYGEGTSKVYAFNTFTAEISELPDTPEPIHNNAAFMLDDGRLMYLLGNNGSEGNLDIFTLQTGEAMAALSASEVEQGGTVQLHIWVDTDQDIGPLTGSAYLVWENVTYGAWHFSAEGREVIVEMLISENLPAGEYHLVISDLSVEGWWLEWHFAPMPLTVTDAPSVADRLDEIDQQNLDLQNQLDDLEQQNQDLQDQLEGLEQQNNDLADDLADLSEANDAKLDAMIGYIILIVAIGALIVGVIILVRKK